jgi:hypothetical protein
MEPICSSETSVATQQTTRRQTPEDDTLHNHRCENLKSYNLNEVYSGLGGLGTRGSVVGWDTMLQAGRSRVRFPIRSLDFLIQWYLTWGTRTPGVGEDILGGT